MSYVLIVDDERDLADLVEFNLKQAGFETAVVGSGFDALLRIKQRLPNLILLDLMLPDLSGAEVCRQLKASAKTAAIPVIMLTAKGEESDRVLGLEAGADDYVTKPFSPRELVLRVKAVLRRAASEPEGKSLPLSLGLLQLDVDAHRCFVDGEEIPLTALEFRFMEYLLMRKGRVQTREQLLMDVWGISSQLETRTIDTHVMRLREKLSKARNYLETVRGVGYRMVNPEEH